MALSYDAMQTSNSTPKLLYLLQGKIEEFTRSTGLIMELKPQMGTKDFKSGSTDPLSK